MLEARNSLGAGNMVSKFVKHVERLKVVVESWTDARGQICVFHLNFIYKNIPGFDHIFFFKILATRV